MVSYTHLYSGGSSGVYCLILISPHSFSFPFPSSSDLLLFPSTPLPSSSSLPLSSLHILPLSNIPLLFHPPLLISLPLSHPLPFLFYSLPSIPRILVGTYITLFISITSPGYSDPAQTIGGECRVVQF